MMGMGCPQAEQTVIKLLAAARNRKQDVLCVFICEGNTVRVAALIQESLLEMCGYHAITPQMQELILWWWERMKTTD